MLKIRTITTKNVRLPYELIRGNVSQRNKLAQSYSDKFANEINNCSKTDYCSADEFRTSLDKVLGENKIKYSLHSKGITDGAAASFNREVTAKDNNSKSIDLFITGFKFYFPNEKNKEKYIKKDYAVHEVRHFFDYLTQPKQNNFRYTGFENPETAEISQKIVDSFMPHLEENNLKNLEKNTREEIKRLPDEKIIDTLQKTKLDLLSEKNAYNDELNYLMKNSMKNLSKIINLKIFINEIQFEKKIEIVNILLKENMQEIRKKQANRKIHSPVFSKIKSKLVFIKHLFNTVN